jgi:hypothetical protein
VTGQWGGQAPDFPLTCTQEYKGRCALVGGGEGANLANLQALVLPWAPNELEAGGFRCGEAPGSIGMEMLERLSTGS